MHLKREVSPKNWPIERKGTTYLIKPSHDFDRGVPILIIIRDMLELAKDRKEVKKALTSGQVFLNHKRVVDEKNNALLFDILTLAPPKSSSSDKKQYYRIEMGENKKFKLQEVSFPRVIHSPIKALHIDQVGLPKTLAFPFDEACFLLKLIHKLYGLVLSAVHFLHDLCDRVDDINTVLLVLPAVFM